MASKQLSARQQQQLDDEIRRLQRQQQQQLQTRFPARDIHVIKTYLPLTTREDLASKYTDSLDVFCFLCASILNDRRIFSSGLVVTQNILIPFYEKIHPIRVATCPSWGMIDRRSQIIADNNIIRKITAKQPLTNEDITRFLRDVHVAQRLDKPGRLQRSEYKQYTDFRRLAKDLFTVLVEYQESLKKKGPSRTFKDL